MYLYHFLKCTNIIFSQQEPCLKWLSRVSVAVRPLYPPCYYYLFGGSSLTSPLCLTRVPPLRVRLFLCLICLQNKVSCFPIVYLARLSFSRFSHAVVWSIYLACCRPRVILDSGFIYGAEAICQHVIELNIYCL